MVVVVVVGDGQERPGYFPFLCLELYASEELDNTVKLPLYSHTLSPKLFWKPKCS